MVECSTADHLCLYLDAVTAGGDGGGDGAGDGARDGDGAGDGVDEGDESGETPQSERSVPAIVSALGLTETGMADRVELFSALSELQDRGLVVEDTATLPEHEGERHVYSLTDAGREHARQVRERLATATVTVRDGGGRETTTLSAAVERLDAEYPLVCAVTDLQDDVLFVEADEEADADDAASAEADAGGIPFVDREAAAATLDDQFERARDGGLRTVVVSGEPGVGKTRLVTEFADRARASGATAIVGRSHPDVAEPYRAFLDAIDDLDPGDRAALADPLTQEDPLDPDDADAVDAQRTARFTEVTEGLARVAAETPLVIVLDDVQWLDPSTTRLCAYVLDRLGDVPVCVVLSVRPSGGDEGVALLGDLPDGTIDERIELDGLDRDATEELIWHLVGTRRVPASFVDAVHERTGGNPLFVNESVSQLLEEGRVTPALDEYPTEADALPVPEAVEESIAARTEALDDLTRELLDLASLVGDVVPEAVLVAASDADDATVRDRIDLLVASQLFHRESRATVRFESPLVRETVADRIPADRRERLHRQLADAYGSLGADIGQRTGTVAHHYYEAGDRESALDTLLSAAERAERLYAHEVAVDAYQQALEIAREQDDDDTVADVLERLGDTYDLLGQYDDALRCFQYVRERAVDATTLARARRTESAIYRKRAEYADSLEAARNGLSLLDDADPSEQLDAEETEQLDAAACRLHESRGRTLGRKGEGDRALEAHQRALEIAASIDDDDHLARALYGLASAHMRMGQFDAAADPLEEAIDHWRAVDNDRDLARALNSLGVVRMRSLDYEAAAGHYRRAYDIASEIGFKRGQATALVNLGALHVERNEPQAARDVLERARVANLEIGDESYLSIVHINLADLGVQTGDLDAATEHAERAREIGERIGARHRVVQATENSAWTAYYRGDLDRARETIASGREIAAELADSHKKVWLLDVLGRVELADGDVDEALALHTEAVEQALEHGIDEQVARTRDGLIRAYLAATDHAEAADQVDGTGHVDAAAEDVDGTGHVDAAADQVDALENSDDPPLETLIALGRYYRTVGEYDRADDYLTDGFERADSSGLSTRVAEFACERARLAGARGDDDRRREFAARALDVAREHDLGLLVDRAETLDTGP